MGNQSIRKNSGEEEKMPFSSEKNSTARTSLNNNQYKNLDPHQLRIL